MKLKKSPRGWKYAEFKDRYGATCSIQESSSGEEASLWLGVDDVEPKVLASQASSVGVQTNETCGWVPYPIPEEVLLSSRMHINIKMAKELVKHLNKFIKTGHL